MSIFIPTEDQKRVFREITETDNNIIISSVAGSGKTTTIVKSLDKIPKNRSVIFLAFNKSVAEELRTRIPPYIDVSTIHGFGARAMFHHFGSKFKENKVFTTCLKHYPNWKKKYGISESKYVYCYMINQIVDLMRLTLTTEDDKIDELCTEYGLFASEIDIAVAKQVFNLVHNNTEFIDFVDMVFQVAVRNIKLPKYDFVYVDEIQDLNKAQQNIVKKIVMPVRGRLIGVGDPHQAIYGFAGADHYSYERMKTLLPNTVELSLSTSFRCPKLIVKKAREIVNHIKASDTQIDGVERLGSIEEIKAGDWVVCRNTYPLVLLFRYLIKQGRKANIRGREIGKNIITLIEKTKKQQVVACVQMIEIMIIQLRTKLYKKGYARPHEHPKMLDLIEKREIIKLLGANVSTVEKLKKNIEKIFLDTKTDGILLTTIHKAKGLENHRIFFLCPKLIPSVYATTQKQLDQEKNLKYVGITRSKNELITVDMTIQELEEVIENLQT